jgi:hypothetical protein
MRNTEDTESHRGHGAQAGASVLACEGKDPPRNHEDTKRTLVLAPQACRRRLPAQGRAWVHRFHRFTQIEKTRVAGGFQESHFEHGLQRGRRGTSPPKGATPAPPLTSGRAGGRLWRAHAGWAGANLRLLRALCVFCVPAFSETQEESLNPVLPWRAKRRGFPTKSGRRTPGSGSAALPG